MNRIFENATIYFNNGIKEIYDAISIADQGVYIGQIKSINNKKEQFIHHKFVPLDQIDKIFFLNKNGKSRDIDFKKFKEERKE